MGSSFTWLDYSEAERRRALDTIDLFRERDTRDALGLGSIRDGFADLLSPGTSTIQTRARYFLLVPWLHRAIERSGSRRPAAAQARSTELRLIESLLSGGDLDGLIGSQARGRLKRLPSDIYWQGLHSWDIRRFPVARESYYRWIDTGAAMPRDDSEEGDPIHGIWHAALPEAPAGFPDEVALTLKPGEAEYLSERLIARWPGSMLTWLVRDGSAGGEVDFPWEHPAVERMPAAIVEQLHHGRCFSEAMLGAQLLYNFMLARQLQTDQDGRADWVEAWAHEIEVWKQMIALRAGALGDWDLSAFWQLVDATGARVTLATRHFVDTWIDHVRDGGDLSLRDKRCQGWIHDRECRVKGRQARLVNRSMLLSWRGQSGSRQLDYRWAITRKYAEEIGGAADA
jgi:hypothetical protein